MAPKGLVGGVGVLNGATGGIFWTMPAPCHALRLNSWRLGSVPRLFVVQNDTETRCLWLPQCLFRAKIDGQILWEVQATYEAPLPLTSFNHLKRLYL